MVLESAAIREEYLSKAENEGDKEVASKLSTEYYSLRVALVSKNPHLTYKAI
jgi:hypothetical protein